jgi:UDP-glucose 4-epimerase
MRKKRILVTGGSGFIGKNLVLKLANMGNKVTVLDIDKDELTKLRDHKNVNVIVGDVTKKKTYSYLPTDFEYIFHLAATVGVEYVSTHPFITMDTEIFGISNIVRFAIRCPNLKKVIYSSTSAIYGNIKTNKQTIESIGASHLSSYGGAKLLAEKYLSEMKHFFGINYLIVRYFNVYGRFQKEKMVIPLFFSQALSEKPIIVFGDGKQSRDFTYVEDALEATIKLADSRHLNGDIFNIGTGNSTRILDLAKEIKIITHSNSPIVLTKPPENRKEYEIERRVCNNKKLKDAINFSFNTTLHQGLKKTLYWIKNPDY